MMMEVMRIVPLAIKHANIAALLGFHHVILAIQLNNSEIKLTLRPVVVIVLIDTLIFFQLLITRSANPVIKVAGPV